MIRIRPNRFVDAFFVAHYLRSTDGRSRLTANAKWAVNQASINQRDICETCVPLPPLAEQLRIVAEVERRLSIIQQAEAAVESSLKRAGRLRQSILKAGLLRPAGAPGPQRRAGLGIARANPGPARSGPSSRQAPAAPARTCSLSLWK